MDRQKWLGRAFLIPVNHDTNALAQIVKITDSEMLIAMFDKATSLDKRDVGDSLESKVFALMGTMFTTPKNGNWVPVGIQPIAHDIPFQAYGWGNLAKNFEDTVGKNIGFEASRKLEPFGRTATWGVLNKYASNHFGIETSIDDHIASNGWGFTVDGLIWKILPEHYPEPKNNRYR